MEWSWSLFFSAFGGMCAALTLSVPVLRYVIKNDATATTKEVLNGIKDRLARVEFSCLNNVDEIEKLREKRHGDISELSNRMMKMQADEHAETMNLLLEVIKKR